MDSVQNDILGGVRQLFGEVCENYGACMFLVGAVEIGMRMSVQLMIDLELVDTSSRKGFKQFKRGFINTRGEMGKVLGALEASFEMVEGKVQELYGEDFLVIFKDLTSTLVSSLRSCTRKRNYLAHDFWKENCSDVNDKLQNIEAQNKLGEIATDATRMLSELQGLLYQLSLRSDHHMRDQILSWVAENPIPAPDAAASGLSESAA